MSESSVAERDMGYKHHVANLESADLDVAYGGTIQNMPSHTSFIYGKHRSEDSHESKYKGSEEATLEDSGLSNPEKISVSSHYRIPWQRKLSKKYPESKEKQGHNPSFRTQFVSGTSERLQQPTNRHGILDARTHSRIKKAPFPYTDAMNVERNIRNQHGITYKTEGNASKWKPIRGHKIIGSFKSRYETTSNPMNSEEDTLTYEGKRQDEEEESDDSITVQNEDGDEGYDDMENDYARKIKETRRIHGSNRGLQSTDHHKAGVVQRIRNQVPYYARINNDARSYTRGSSSRYSENEADDNERTENIIQSRIEHLKDSIKREMTREF
jgi:hypothetical protein